MRGKPLLMFGMLCVCIFVLCGCANQTASSSGSSTQTINPSPSLESGSFSNVSVEDKIDFGTYNNEPITWQVLDKQDDKMLLLSDKVLYRAEYDDGHTRNVTWADCTLRASLNGDFYNNSFSDVEKTKILMTHVVNSDNMAYETPGGEDTDDKIFLLSIDEANRYFVADNIREATTLKGESIWWWLRSPGRLSYYAAGVHYGGEIDEDGNYVEEYSDFRDKEDNIIYYYGGVRPAMWVNLE